MGSVADIEAITRELPDRRVRLPLQCMGEFHRQGLAREYFCVGMIRRRLTWQQGLPISQTQLAQPAGGRG